MANHKSAQKRIRRNDRRKVINGNRVSRIRTFVKKVLVAVDTGDKAVAETAYKNAQPEIMRGVSKGLIHKNTAARMMSRLSQKIKSIA
jgi:small subunit ribosomal protein S20